MLAGGKVQTFNVLLIAEDPKQIEVYSDLLREVADCHIDVISKVDSSFEWFERFNYYHLVIVDMVHGMPPGIDELVILERVRRVSPMTSVIIVSERASVEHAVAAIRMGAEDYLNKPFNLETFKLAVKRGLDREAVYGDDAGASGYVSLLNSCQMISATLEQDRIFGIIRSFFARELRSQYTAIYSMNGEQVSRIDDVGNEAHRDAVMEEIIDITIHGSSPFRGMIEANEIYRFAERGQLTPGFFIFHFRCVGEIDYFCVCLSPTRPAPMDAFESRLRMLRTQIDVTGKNIQQYIGVQNLIYIDEVTGLYNTRYLNAALDREIARVKTDHTSFAILFIDIDKFKQVNDGHGHLVGTKLLNELGALLSKQLREADSVFRYGGDEFVALLAPCDLETACTVAERVRASVEQRKFLAREGLNIHFTISIGVALFPAHAQSKKAIIDMADKAMYSAKKRSRNSVSVASVVAPGGKSG